MDPNDGDAGQAPGIYGDAFNPKPWTPADNSLKFFVDPETMKTIDFSGDAPPETPPWLAAGDGAADGQTQPPQPDDGGFYTGLMPFNPASDDTTPDLPGQQSGDTTSDGPAQQGAPDTTQAPQKSPLTVWPVPGHTQLNPRKPKVGQGDGSFGAFRDHGGHAHTGIDITAPVGTPVVAAGDGTVASTQPGKDYGKQVIIQHAGGFGTQYGHLSRVDVKPGTAVHAGDQIGLSGTSGNVPNGADSHVHFEVRHGNLKPHSAGGQVVDPMQYLPAKP